MRIKLEGPIAGPTHLPVGLGPADVGRTWWSDIYWFIWTGDRWQQAIATTTKPKARV